MQTVWNLNCSQTLNKYYFGFEYSISITNIEHTVKTHLSYKATLNITYACFVLLYQHNIFVTLCTQMAALADLKWAAENTKGWLKLSPTTHQSGTLYNPEVLCTTMLYKAVLSSGKTCVYLKCDLPIIPPNHYDTWNIQITHLWSSLTAASAGMASFLGLLILASNVRRIWTNV